MYSVTEVGNECPICGSFLKAKRTYYKRDENTSQRRLRSLRMYCTKCSFRTLTKVYEKGGEKVGTKEEVW